MCFFRFRSSFAPVLPDKKLPIPRPSARRYRLIPVGSVRSGRDTARGLRAQSRQFTLFFAGKQGAKNFRKNRKKYLRAITAYGIIQASGMSLTKTGEKNGYNRAQQIGLER
jgi:hypothetical protein